MAGEPTPPFCVGTYEQGHAECDGKPCGWRDKCGALKVYVETTDAELGQWMNQATDKLVVDPHEFNEFCLRLVRRYNIVEGVPQEQGAIEVSVASTEPEEAPVQHAKPDSLEPTGGGSKRRPKPKPKPDMTASTVKRVPKRMLGAERRRTKGTNSAWATKRRDEVTLLFDHFVDKLMGQFPDRVLANGKQATLPGQFYFVDRRKQSGYVSFYCRTAGGWDACVVSIRLKPRGQVMDAQLPLTLEEFTAGVGKKSATYFDMRPVTDGRFRMRLLNLDREDAALLAEAIGKLARSGTMGLPDA